MAASVFPYVILQGPVVNWKTIQQFISVSFGSYTLYMNQCIKRHCTCMWRSAISLQIHVHCVCVCEIHFKLTFLILLFNRLDFTICFAAQYFYEPSFISTKTLFGCSKTSNNEHKLWIVEDFRLTGEQMELTVTVPRWPDADSRHQTYDSASADTDTASRTAHLGRL